MCEIPVHFRPRRLVDWINPTGAKKKVHSLIDKVFKRENLKIAWDRVRANKGSGGVDGQSMAAFAAQQNQQLERLHGELKENTYQPLPVRQVPIEKRDKPGEYRLLGIPTIYDRVCQQALLNRLEPIFEPLFDDANFGYRRGRSTKDALRKIWREIDGGREWIVDADLRDFFGSVDHEKLLTLIAQQVADGRVLRLIRAMLKAGSYGKGRLFPTERGTPQGGVELHPQKTRVVHVQQGFEFLGYKIKRAQKKLRLPASKIRSQLHRGALYAYPREKSIRRFMDQVRQRTKRNVPLKTKELIEELNPLLRGWGEYYKRAHVRRLFHRLDGWIVRRIWSHRYKRWRNSGWKRLPASALYGEHGLVNLIGLIPSVASRSR
jgi:RNA-directed DNA polymerase